MKLALARHLKMNLKLNFHLRKYWSKSVDFFEDGDYALAAFFAITLIEEVGKANMLFFSEDHTEKIKGFRHHASKYTEAVITTLSLNSRISRVYGNEEKRFASWYKEGKLFQIRNNALYAELCDGKLLLPEEQVNAMDSFLLVCISGEVLAEIQGLITGTGPVEWQRQIDEIELFREKNLDVVS